MAIYAKKSLGQNFLRSKRALTDIIEAADIQLGDTIVEIGPGEGALTELLLEKLVTVEGGRLIAVEKDDRLIPILSEKFKKELISGHFILIHGDILELQNQPEALKAIKSLKIGTFKVVANIPYYITGLLLPMILEGDLGLALFSKKAQFQPQKAVLLVQEEVAKRVLARDKKESILSISVKVYGEPRIVSKVPRGAFVPAPNVDSAILAVENISKDFFKGFNEKELFTLVKSGFAHKRKIVSANLKKVGINKDAAIENILKKDTTKLRAEDMTLEEWGVLAKSA